MARDIIPFSLETLGASIPGGVARQYRVQFRTTNQTPWQMHSNFLHVYDALCCAQDLRSEGVEVRVVRYGNSPAAA